MIPVRKQHTRLLTIVLVCSAVALAAGALILWVRPDPIPPNPEQYVLDHFAGPDTTEADGWKIIKALPGVDWAKMSHLDSSRAFEVLEWLWTSDLGAAAESMTYIMRGSTHLDGAYAEQYANVVGRLYETHGRAFITAMGCLDAGDMDDLAGYLGYYVSGRDQEPNLKTEMEALLALPSLSAREHEAIEAILQALARLPG